jgi:antitoxin component of MazEF toxin-antitoxin module
MGYPTKVQCIKRKQSAQWYIAFPAALAKAMNFQQSEDVDWIIEDNGHLVLERKVLPPKPMEKIRIGFQRY